MIFEIVPAAVCFGETVRTAARVSRSLSGMKNFPSLCVVDVRGMPIRLDNPNVTFNPEGVFALEHRYGPNTVTPVSPSVTNDTVYQPFFGEQPSYDLPGTLYQENIPGDDQSFYLHAHVDELGRGLCKDVDDCDGILPNAGSCDASTRVRKSRKPLTMASGSSGGFV